MEGCVRETYGALCAIWQAEHSTDPAVREVTARIVFEESRHAAMSWELARWLEPQLTPDQQDECRAAMRAAIAELAQDAAIEPPPTLAAIAGLPPAEEAVRMFEMLQQTIWA